MKVFKTLSAFCLGVTFFISCSDNDILPDLINNIPNETVRFLFNGSLTDGTGTIENASVTGATVSTDRKGSINAAYSFDGTNDYINMGDSSVLEVDSVFSVSIWFKPQERTTKGPMILFNKEGEFEVAVRNDDKYEIEWTIAESNNRWYTDTWVKTGDTVAIDTWSHLGLTYNKGNVKIYLDGQEIDNKTDLNYPIGDVAPTLNELWIGGRQAFADNGNSSYFKGELDDFRLYHRALTGVEIKLLAGDK